MSNKICETSLRWILAVRSRRSVHNFDTRLIDGLSHPEVFGDGVVDFGHSGGSYRWALTQAKKIETIGLDKWLQTTDALGYEYVFKNQLRDFLK